MLFARRRQALFTSVENNKLRRIKGSHFLTMKRSNLNRPLRRLKWFNASKTLYCKLILYLDIQKMLMKLKVKELLVIEESHTNQQRQKQSPDG